MIYLNNTTESQVVYIPRDTDLSGTLQMSARSTVGLDIVLNVTMLDLKLHRLCYAMAVTLPDGTPSGEYEYILRADGEQVSTGVMVVRDGTTDAEQYNKEITYEQYNGQ